MADWLHKIYWNLFTIRHARGEGRFPYSPIEEILVIQNRRVRAIVSHAYETVPYYRRVMDEIGLRPDDVQTADDLAKLPLVTCEQVARAPEQFLSRRYANGRSLPLHTTGTSGYSKTIHYDPAALFLSLAHGHRQRAVLAQFVGRTFGYREIVVVRPDSISVRLRDFYEANSWVPRGFDLERSVLSPKGCFEENIQQINAFQPAVIYSNGSYIGALFRWAWEHNAHIFRPKVVWYSSDHMASRDRQLIETEFGAPVFSTYQTGEALRIAFQCERREGFHINLDQVAVRVVDGNGNTVGPGVAGEIVLSNLTNRATVLLNYELGDEVTLSQSRCPCGRTLPLIEQIEGRTDSLIVRPGEQMMYGSIVTESLHTIPGIVQVQLIQQDLQRFLLRAVCADGVDWEQTCRSMDNALRATLGKDISVKIERVEIIPPGPGGKVRAIISMVGSE